jgi:hypothetical protein
MSNPPLLFGLSLQQAAAMEDPLDDAEFARIQAEMDAKRAAGGEKKKGGKKK